MEFKYITVFASLSLFGFLEILFPFFNYRQNLIRKFSTNFLLGLLNLITSNLTIIWLLKWVWEQTPLLGFLNNNIQSPWLGFSLCFLILDCYMYFWHRLMHSLPLAWRFHQVHHTDCSMNISTAYRFHPVETILSSLPKIFLIYLFGIKLNFLMIYESLFTASVIFHHSNLYLPLKIDKFLSYLIVTPNYHRSHHSQFIKDMQNNYTSILTIWDVICRSYYYPLVPKSIQLGLAENTRDFSIISLLKFPYK